MAALAEVAEVVVGGTPSTRQPAYWNGDLVWITPTDLTAPHGRIISDSARRISEDGVARSSARVVPRGSVLVCTRATIGPAAIAGCPVATNQGVTALVPGSSLLSEWLYFWVLANRREFVARAAGNTFPEVSRSKTRAIPISVPDRDHQRRAADLLSHAQDVLFAAEAAAAASRVLLRTMREHLVEDGGPLTFPLGSVLLGIEAGKSPSAEDRQPGPGERAVLKVSAVRPGWFEHSEVKTLASDAQMPPHIEVHGGDLLIARANANADYVGAVCLVPEIRPGLFLCDKTLRLLLDTSAMDPRYAVHALATKRVRRDIVTGATGSTTAKNISQAKLRGLDVALPSLGRQREVANALDAIAAAEQAYRLRARDAYELLEALLQAYFVADDAVPITYDRMLSAGFVAA